MCGFGVAISQPGRHSEGLGTAREWSNWPFLSQTVCVCGQCRQHCATILGRCWGRKYMWDNTGGGVTGKIKHPTGRQSLEKSIQHRAICLPSLNFFLLMIPNHNVKYLYNENVFLVFVFYSLSDYIAIYITTLISRDSSCVYTRLL